MQTESITTLRTLYYFKYYEINIECSQKKYMFIATYNKYAKKIIVKNLTIIS